MIIPPALAAIGRTQHPSRTGCVNSLWDAIFWTTRRGRNDVIRHPQFNQVDTVALGADFSSSADQPLNCLAFVTDVKSVKELLPIEFEYEQPDGR
jgi:hypothetical protein